VDNNILNSIKIKFSHKIKTILTDVVNRPYESYRVDWYSKTQNFGDILNPILIAGLTGKKIIQVSSNKYNKPHCFVIGSILARATKHTTIWGSGLISQDSICNEVPAKICAVRGPLTRDVLLKQNIPCPEVYGDPALLLPKLFSPSIQKKYKLGIIPHYVDNEHPSLAKFVDDSDVKVLDIQDPNPYNFICHLLSCEKIISSSLHGIIVADAYGIPSLWGEFSDKVTGGGFKFFDYFASVGRNDTEAINMSKVLNVNHLIDKFYDYEIKIDLDLLLANSPFEIDLQLPFSERNKPRT